METLESRSKQYFIDLRQFCEESHPEFLGTIGNSKRKPILVEFRKESIGLVPLTRGMYSLVDPDKIDYVGDRLWSYATFGKSKIGYARGYETQDGIKFKCIGLHIFLFGRLQGMVIDHKNCFGTDNRTNNIRFCTHQQNAMNRKHQVGCSSIYKGVSWYQNKQLWMSSIRKDGILKNLGYYADEIQAAKAYDQAAIQTFGEFARINFPDPSLLLL